MIFNIAKFLMKASLAVFVYLSTCGVSVQAADLDCHPVPDCKRMGYSQADNSECSANGYIYCPFDKSYKKCVNYSCERMGFTADDKSSWCSSIVQCPNDPAYTLCDQLCKNQCPSGSLTPECPYGANPDPVAYTDCHLKCYGCLDCTETCEKYSMLTEEQAESQCLYGKAEVKNICAGGAQARKCYECQNCTDVCNGKRSDELPTNFSSICYSYRENTVCGSACYQNVAAYTCSHFNAKWTENTSDTDYTYRPVNNTQTQDCGLTCYEKVSRECPSSGGAVGTIDKEGYDARNFHCTENGTNASGDQCYLCKQCSSSCTDNGWLDSKAGVDATCSNIEEKTLDCGKKCYKVTAKTCNQINKNWWENDSPTIYTYTKAADQCNKTCYTRCDKRCPENSSTTNRGAGYNCSDVGTNGCGEKCWSCSEISCIHGTISGSTCVCSEGWEGDDCNTPSPCDGHTHLSCQDDENGEACKSGDDTYYKCTPKECYEMTVGGRPLSATPCAAGQSQTEYPKINKTCYLCSDAICNSKTFSFMGENYAYETTEAGLGCLGTLHSSAETETITSGGATQQCFKCTCDTQEDYDCTYSAGNEKEVLGTQCCNGQYKTCERKCDGYNLTSQNATGAKSFDTCSACDITTYKITECLEGYELKNGVCSVRVCDAEKGYSTSITEASCNADAYEIFETDGYSGSQVCGRCGCNQEDADEACQAVSSGYYGETLGKKCCNGKYTSCAFISPKNPQPANAECVENLTFEACGTEHSVCSEYACKEGYSYYTGTRFKISACYADPCDVPNKGCAYSDSNNQCYSTQEACKLFNGCTTGQICAACHIHACNDNPIFTSCPDEYPFSSEPQYNSIYEKLVTTTVDGHTCYNVEPNCTAAAKTYYTDMATVATKILVKCDSQGQCTNKNNSLGCTKHYGTAIGRCAADYGISAFDQSQTGTTSGSDLLARQLELCEEAVAKAETKIDAYNKVCEENISFYNGCNSCLGADSDPGLTGIYQCN